MPEEIKIQFEDLDTRTASRFIQELEGVLLTEIPLERMNISSRKGNMDSGTILTIILGAPSVVAVAKGISDYLRRRNNARISIKKGDDSIIASGIDSKTAVKIIEILENEVRSK